MGTAPASQSRDLSTGLLPPGPTVGWEEKWALPRALAEPRVQLRGRQGWSALGLQPGDWM